MIIKKGDMVHCPGYFKDVLVLDKFADGKVLLIESQGALKMVHADLCSIEDYDKCRECSKERLSNYPGSPCGCCHDYNRFDPR